MVTLQNEKVMLLDGCKIVPLSSQQLSSEMLSRGKNFSLQNAPSYREGTMAYKIMRAHSSEAPQGQLRLKFDALISHDITYVGIIQTARGSGMKEFPLPYVLTNCHNSLCAVGGTINEDDHIFGLSAAKKYGGIYVPANQAVIHQFAREMLSGTGKMILGSDSHTRYGALGTMGVGEGGPELVKQLLKNTYDVAEPEVILVYLEGAPQKGIGPHDVAIALCKAVFANGFVKNKILEFTGPGVASLPIDFRIGIDVMTTETACLSSIWHTDETVQNFYALHGRSGEYKQLSPDREALYDGVVHIDLSKVESMIALPFHPSNAFTVHELQQNAADIFHAVEADARRQFGDKISFDLSSKIVDGKVMVDQGVIAGCAGGMFDNICEAADILEGGDIGNSYFNLSVYPSSTPINMALLSNNVQHRLMASGAVFKPCFCGPCFGAGDVPGNNGLSIRHTTRNFPNREGSKPGDGQLAGVALMDARSIAATARSGGVLTAATDVEYEAHTPYQYQYEQSVYDKRVYFGFGKAQKDTELRFGPNIADWPKFAPLADNLLVKLAAVIHDEVTTTDELIPSGETSSYRSNPLKLSEFALSRREPAYVGRSKAVREMDAARMEGKYSEELLNVLAKFGNAEDLAKNTQFGSAVFARRPGDGSAREQAASCQKVLGGMANICYEYATKRYRSNCINWGILPFTLDKNTPFDYNPDDYVFVPNIRKVIEQGLEEIDATVVSAVGETPIKLYVKGLTEDEKEIILRGCLMNYYAAKNDK